MAAKKRGKAASKSKFLDWNSAQESSSGTNAARTRCYQDSYAACTGKNCLEKINLVLKARCVLVGCSEARDSGSSQGFLDAATTEQLCLA